MNDDTKLEAFRYKGTQEGKRLTVLGGVHGNEPCGTRALNRLKESLDEGRIEITHGELVIVPICNPRARALNVRYVERNLNRSLYPKENPSVYEDYLDLQLCPLLEQTDYLLDLHSYKSQGGAFIFLGPKTSENIAYAKALNISSIIYGWADAMQNSVQLTDKRHAMGTTEYAREHGAIALTLECGTHNHPRGADIGYQAALNALQYAGLAKVHDDLQINDLPSNDPYFIKMRGVVMKERAGSLAKNWENMDQLAKGEEIAHYDDGEILLMPEDGFIVLPDNDPPLGQEWYFWGVKEDL